MKKQETKEQAVTELDEDCYYCKRVRWGNYQYLGNGHWRHQECYPGSQPWREYFEQLPESKRTPAGKCLYFREER